MPALETVAIVSWKDPTQMWRINRIDYDPERHTLWSEAPSAPMPAEPPALEVDGDFVTDETGAVTEMTIVDPQDQRRRLVIPAADYDPDQHILWSERKK